MEHPEEGTVRGLGIPVKLSDTPGSVRRAAPLLGEHTDEVLREAGFAAEEIGARCERAGDRAVARPGGVGHVRPPRGAQRDDVRDVRGAVRRAARRPTPTTTCARWCCAARAARRSWPAPTSASSPRSRRPRTASRYEATIDRIVGRLETVGKPTVALVDGFAMGSGLALSATCDLRICTPAAKFGLPIARTVGNCLSMANYARLAALLGPARLKDIVFTARAIEAGRGARDRPRHRGGRRRRGARGRSCARRSPRTRPSRMRVTKEALRRLRDADLPDGDDLVREAYGSEDFRAVAAGDR